MNKLKISVLAVFVIGIVIVSILPSSFASNHIPVWIKNNAEWCDVAKTKYYNNISF